VERNAHLERANVLFQQSRYDLAEQELRQGLAIEPESSYGHALLALCLLERKQYGEANTEAEQAIHKQPDDAFAHYTLAVVLHERNLIREAFGAVREAIRIDPDDAQYHGFESHLHLEERNWPAALASADRGLEANPEHEVCLNVRAVALVKLNRRVEAGSTIEAALAREPESAMTHANQGWALLEQSKPEKAMEHFREALRLEPSNEWARQGIVEALKARYFIYSLMLRYFLWSAKLSQRAGFMVMFGGYFAYRGLMKVSDRNPSWAPYIWPFLAAYFAFVLMTWISRPMFNLVLRLNKFGRMALSSEEIRASNGIGLCLGVAAGCLVCWGISGVGMYSVFALIAAVLAIPVAATYTCAPGWPRNLMGTVAVVLALMAIAMAAIYFLPIPKADEKHWLGRFRLLASIFSIGILASSIGAGFLSQVRPKR